MVMPRNTKSRPAGNGAAQETEGTIGTSLAPPTDITVYRACRATYQHLRARGLVSEVVVAELRRLLREATP